MKSNAPILFACLCAATMQPACSKSNNLLLGRVEAAVGGHAVVVTDCYKLSVPPPRKLQDAADGRAAYRFTPCRDADVVIRGEELIVNGKSYGRLSDGDSVTVDHGRVLINDREAGVTASK